MAHRNRIARARNARPSDTASAPGRGTGAASRSCSPTIVTAIARKKTLPAHASSAADDGTGAPARPIAMPERHEQIDEQRQVQQLLERPRPTRRARDRARRTPAPSPRGSSSARGVWPDCRRACARSRRCTTMKSAGERRADRSDGPEGPRWTSVRTSSPRFKEPPPERDREEPQHQSGLGERRRSSCRGCRPCRRTGSPCRERPWPARSGRARAVPTSTRIPPACSRGAAAKSTGTSVVAATAVAK